MCSEHVQLNVSKQIRKILLSHRSYTSSLGQLFKTCCKCDTGINHCVCERAKTVWIQYIFCTICDRVKKAYIRVLLIVHVIDIRVDSFTDKELFLLV